MGGAAALGTVLPGLYAELLNKHVITFKRYYLMEMKRRQRKKHHKTTCNKCFQHHWAPWSVHGFGGYEITGNTDAGVAGAE